MEKTIEQITKASQHMRRVNSSLTQEERIERARKAGVASGQSRRKRRLMRDTLSELLTAEIPVELADIRSQLQEMGAPCDLQTALCLAALNRAIRGDIEAARFCRDSVGDKLPENLNVSATEEKPFSQIDLSEVSTADLMRMIAETSESEEP